MFFEEAENQIISWFFLISCHYTLYAEKTGNHKNNVMVIVVKNTLFKVNWILSNYYNQNSGYLKKKNVKLVIKNEFNNNKCKVLIFLYPLFNAIRKLLSKRFCPNVITTSNFFMRLCDILKLNNNSFTLCRISWSASIDHPTFFSFSLDILP